MSRTLGKRKQKRIEAVYPIRLWGMDANGRPFIEAAATLNVSRGGALIKDAAGKLRVGEIVGLKSGDNKCRFQVMWIGQPGTPEAGHLGLKSLEEQKQLWDLELPDGDIVEMDTYTRPPQRENRLLTRLNCSISAEVGSAGSPSRVRAFITDISLGGCYVSMPAPFPPEAKVTIALWLGHNIKIWMDGIVISQHQGVGIGVKFVNLSRKHVEELNQLLEILAHSQLVSSGDAEEE